MEYSEGKRREEGENVKINGKEVWEDKFGEVHSDVPRKYLKSFNEEEIFRC